MILCRKKFNLSTWNKINNTTFNKIRLVLLNDMTKSKTTYNQFFKGGRKINIKNQQFLETIDYLLFSILSMHMHLT